MSTYKLQPPDGNIGYQKITTGRKWVGRVTQHQDGDWIGILGKLMIRRPTKDLAFDDVVAMHLGYKSGAELRERNAVVRRVKGVLNKRADAALDRYFQGGGIETFGKMLDTPQGATAAIAAFSRSLRRDRRKVGGR